jgi:hypothetical protein
VTQNNAIDTEAAPARLLPLALAPADHRDSLWAENIPE